jgi:hypothetical protein
MKLAITEGKSENKLLTDYDDYINRKETWAFRMPLGVLAIEMQNVQEIVYDNDGNRGTSERWEPIRVVQGWNSLKEYKSWVKDTKDKNNITVPPLQPFGITKCWISKIIHILTESQKLQHIRKKII